MAVTLKINGVNYTAGQELGPNYTLNTFIRNNALLFGTKKMCAEGGCGACVVHVSYKDSSSNDTINKSINSCMIPVFACDGWSVTTVEGLGDRKRGYHSIQKRLANYNGTQCGFCTPGFVMNMYGILTNDPKPTEQHIEDSFDGNICRCTGYRPILDAMKSFANVSFSEIPDIEDGNKACCGKSGYTICNNSCKDSQNGFEMMSAEGTKTLKNAHGMWHQPNTLDDMYTILKDTLGKKVRIVVGNTGTGVFKYDGPYDHYIDPRNITELHDITDSDDKLVFGAAITLSQLIEKLKSKGTDTSPSTPSSSIWSYFSSSSTTSKSEGWEFCKVLAHHISYIANTPVRNAGCWAGNLMMKHDHNDFPSDMFLIMETAGATLTVATHDGTIKDNIKPSDFIKMDMKGKMLLKLTLHKLTSQHIMRTFKITIRSQNSHAYINAGFRFELSKENKVLSKPNILFGGVNKDFTHAFETEKLLTDAQLGDSQTIKTALTKLELEIQPDSSPVLSSPTYRKSLCLSLFYKFVLGVLGEKLPPKYQSGGPSLERPLSEGKRIYYTKENEWPVTKPVPKLEGLIQCSGEAEYSGDQQPLKDQLYGAFALSTEGSATISKIDTSPALNVEGVENVFTAKDIPGINDFAKPVTFFGHAEEILASKTISYAGQPIALVVAETEYIAEMAAKLVKVTYTDVKKPILTIREAIEQKSFWPHSMSQAVIAGNVEEGFKMSDKVIEGELGLGGQYHFHMETQTTACIPTDEGLDVHCATQMMDLCQGSIATVLGVKSNFVNMKTKRLGGAYGAKLSRSFMTAVGCALGSYLTNKPVLMHLPLETNMNMIGKRLPYLAKYKVGVTEEGKLNAVQIYFYNDSGSTPNEQTGTSAVQFGDSAYFCKNWKLVPIPCKTNTPSNTSCRAPAWLQGATFIEEVLENVAFTLGKSPIDIKAMNLIKDGQKTAMKKNILNCLISGMVPEFREMSEFDERKSEIDMFNQNNMWKKKGLSVIMMRYPFDYFGIKFNSMVTIYGLDGTVAVSHGGIEMGQGLNTKAAQVCAYELGIPLSMVKIKATTSLISPNNTPTGGSIGSEMICWGTIKACEILKARMAPVKKTMQSPTWVELVQECNKRNVDLCARNEYSPSDVPGGYDIYGMTAAEVEIDVLTGTYQIPRVDILYDGGQSLNPDVDIGQIEGAFVMGVGLMTSEDLKYDPKSGALLTNNTWEYKPPTTKDIPIKFNIRFVPNARNPLGVLGSKASGEPPLCMSGTVLFALRDAVQAARNDAGLTDRIVIDAPATPEKIHNNCSVTTDRMKI